MDFLAQPLGFWRQRQALVIMKTHLEILIQCHDFYRPKTPSRLCSHDDFCAHI